MGGRVEPDGGDAGHPASDEIVGLALELVEPADRHRRITGHRGFDTEPVAEPSHPDGLDVGDTGHGPDGLFGAVDQCRVDAIQQAAADNATEPLTITTTSCNVAVIASKIRLILTARIPAVLASRASSIASAAP